jgi:Icc-related predicted phosphoesterase
MNEPRDPTAIRPPGGDDAVVRIAAAGDIHCRESIRGEIAQAFAALKGKADLVLLAGDLTSLGDPDEARVLADACAPLEIPVVTVLGNHDWHANRVDEVIDVLTAAGIKILDRDFTIVDANGTEIGVVGTKGFVGGFPGSHLPDFGEPALRMIYAEATAEVKALARGLRAVATCPIRIVLLHYSPSEQTLEGEAAGIWAFLGTDRLAGPIREHEPDLVLHGHAHHGTLEGSIGGVPVYNVSVPLMRRAFWIFELSGERQPAPPVH